MTVEKWSWRKMNKRIPKIIEDNKRRGEWAESVFAARAAAEWAAGESSLWGLGKF